MLRRKDRGMLRQGFDERNSQRPDVFLGRNRGGLHFGGVVDVAAAEKLAPVADGKNGIAGKLQAVVSGEYVRGFQMAVDQALAVKVDEYVEGRVENVPHFFRGERSLRQNFAEILFSKFHDRINEWRIVQTAAAG